MPTAEPTSERSAGRPQAMAELSPWARKLTKVLDDWGLDPIIGFLLPGVGDFATAGMAAFLLLLGIKERVPTVILLRMVMNIAIDALVGSIPLLGDAFDVFFRANRRNLDLIERHRGADREPSVGDYLVVASGFTLAIVGALLPPLLLFGLGTSIGRLLFGG